MSDTVTSVLTFRIESTFDEWSSIIDNEEAYKRHLEFEINPLFTGVNKDDPQGVIVIHQTPEGEVQKIEESKGDWMATHKVDLSTMDESYWNVSLIKESYCD